MNDLSIGTLACLLVVVLFAPAAARADEQPSAEDWGYEEQLRDLLNPDPYGLNLFPVALYTPETSFGAGGALILTMRDPHQPRDSRPDTLQAFAMYTLKNQALLTVVPDVYLDGENWEIKLVGAYSKMPDSFFGNGNDSDEDSEESFVAQSAMVQPWVMRRVWRSFRLGVWYDLKRSSVIQREPEMLLDQRKLAGSRGGLRSGLGPAVDLDSRDNTFFPLRGGWYQFNACFYEEALGSDFDYQAYVIDLRRYIGLGGMHVLAVQAYATWLSGGVPFNERTDMQGIRGIYAGRFNDRMLIRGQVEYRFPIYWRFSGATFVAAGDVSDSLQNYELELVKYAAGAGVRFALDPDERINLRLDLGVSPWGVFPYFMIGESF